MAVVATLLLELNFRYLDRLNAPPTPAEQWAVERTLGVARLALALIGVGAVIVDPTEPTGYSTLVFSILTGWVIYSVLLLLLLPRLATSKKAIAGLHFLDILWPLALTVLTHGPSSPFFALFTFTQIGAAFRWGFPESLATSFVGVTLLGIEAAALTATTKPFHELLAGEFEINRLIVRSTYLVAIGYLVGKLGEDEKQRKAESLVVTRLLRSTRAESGVTGSFRSFFEELMRIYDGERPYAVTQDLNSDRIYLWHGAPKGTPELEPYVIEDAHSRALLMHGMPRTFFATKRDSGDWRIRALDGTSLRDTLISSLPDISTHSEPIDSILCSRVELGHEWVVRILVVNARVGNRAAQELRFLELLSAQAMAAIYSVYLVRRLRARVGATERARVARELHDGAIQSLISAEMRVDVLRRSSERSELPLSKDLKDVQELLRTEVLNLRELMQQMRPVDLGPHQLLDFLADTVDRFRRDTGLQARFVSDVNEDIALTPHSCREIIRIAQEALANIRKHAHAENVLVTFFEGKGFYFLEVSDDGKGFDFSGTMAFADLLNTSRGPTVLKERVHTIRGELTIDSTPGKGSRLKIKVPMKGRSLDGNERHYSAHPDRG